MPNVFKACPSRFWSLVVHVKTLIISCNELPRNFAPETTEKNVAETLRADERQLGTTKGRTKEKSKVAMSKLSKLKL